MALQRVMVRLGDANYDLTYEVEGPVHVGDAVLAPYGNWNPTTYVGVVTALGIHERVYEDGRVEPPYTGPCKVAVVTGCPHTEDGPADAKGGLDTADSKS